MRINSVTFQAEEQTWRLIFSEGDIRLWHVTGRKKPLLVRVWYDYKTEMVDRIAEEALYDIQGTYRLDEQEEVLKHELWMLLSMMG